MTPTEYTRKAVNAAPIYRLLFEQAVSLLPPLDPPEGVNVECFFSAMDISAALNGVRTVSNVRNELTWLQNWGWIKTRKGTSRRFLGRRKDARVFYLMADLAAHAVTQEKRLISREVLGIHIEDAAEVTDKAIARMGAGRKWTGDTTAKSGGASIEQLG